MRPLSLRLHVPVQAGLFIATWACNAHMCALPALQHPAAQRATGAAYAALLALPGAGHRVPPHGPLGQCRALLNLLELLLGLLVPTAALAATEAALYRQYRAHWVQ